MATSPPMLTLTADQTEVKAGGTILLTAVLAHGGPETGEYALSIRGVDAAWVTFVPPTLSVTAGGQATATILVAPPVSAAAADLVLTVRAAGTTANATAEATFSVRLISTTSAANGRAGRQRRLTWPRLLLLSAGVLLIAAAAGFFVIRQRHSAPPPLRTADCASQSTKVVDLYSDDTTTAIRITDPDLADVRILRTEPADTLSPLFSSLLSLSPDGSHLAYVTASNEALDDAHLWSLDIANPAQRQELAAVPRGLWLVRPSWSPDNKHVAFLRVNEQQAAASQSQLELWVADLGGQPHKVAAPPELRPDGFYGSAAQPLCWAQDNQSVIFSSVTRDSSPTDQGTHATGASPAAGAIDAGVPHQIAVDVQTGTTEQLAFPLSATDGAPTVPPAPAGGAGCGLPVFSQNDPTWRNVIMKSSGDTIGRFGCAVTATAMLLNYYGASLTPAQLNTCLGPKADLIDWVSVVPCADGAITASNAFDFAWPSLDQVLASGNPAIVGMVRGQTGLHFVVVTAGGGGSASDYAVIDPWDGTTTKTLQTFLDAGYNLRWIRTYTGTDRPCPRLVAQQTPAGNASGVAPPPDGPLLVPSQLLPLFSKVADQTGVPRELLLAIARIESGFTPRSTGPLIEKFNGTEDAHALGMMQFLPSTYRTFSTKVDAATGHALGDAGIWDPEASIWATAFFLQQHGVTTDQRGALVAYNNADGYVDLVLKTAQQFKAGTIPDPNLYDPNGTSKPGTLAAPNPANPPPLSASTAATSSTTTTNGGSAAQTTSGNSSTTNTNGGGASTSGTSGTTSGGSGAATAGTGASFVPIRWSIPEGSISRGDVQLDFNASDNIGQIVKLTLLTLTVPGSTASPVNQSTPSRPFTPGTVVSDEGVYEAVAVTQQAGKTRLSRI
ncbi:MAG: transglycosylase SLT domain-containing protein [Thermomicrobiales bacterium]